MCQSIVWFSLIKAKSESSEEGTDNKFIWAFDEPETHLYPSAQRELFDILKKIFGHSCREVQLTSSVHPPVN